MMDDKKDHVKKNKIALGVTFTVIFNVPIFSHLRPHISLIFFQFFH